MRRIILETQIWGEWYCDMFIKHVFPYVKEMVSEINKYPIELHLYLDECAEIKLLSYLERLPINSQIFHIEEISKSDWLYTKEADCKFHCMSRAVELDAAIIFVDPNQIVSRGSWAYMLRQIEQGYDACVSKALRTTKNITLEGQRESKELVKLAFEFLHPLYETWKWQNLGKVKSLPCATFYEVDKTCLIAHGLHMAIPMVYPKTKGRREGFSPDHCFNTGWGLDEIKVIDDSSDAFFLEICKDVVEYKGEFSETSSLERWKQMLSEPCFTKQNLENALTPIFIHSEGVKDFVNEFSEITQRTIKEEIARR